MADINKIKIMINDNKEKKIKDIHGRAIIGKAEKLVQGVTERTNTIRKAIEDLLSLAGDCIRKK